MIDVTILAILQGIAEFLPISSSGHLVIGQHLLGVNAPGMRLDLMLHAGTLLSIFVFYWAVIFRILSRFEWRYMLRIVASAIPAIIAYVLFDDQIESLFESARAVGGCLLLTGVVLIATRFLPSGRNSVGFGHALAMGVAQALALLPGVSRSGMTLAASRAVRVEPGAAAEFSFLMSAPLIMGGVLLEILKSLKGGEAVAAAEQPSWALLVYGAVLAAVVGYISLALLVRSLKSRWFWLFGVYCFVAGLFVLFRL